MQWFSNLKTAQKILSLIVLIAVFLGLVGFAGLYFNNKTSESLSEMYHKSFKTVEGLNKARSNGNAVKADLLEMLVNPDLEKQNKLIKDIEKRKKDTAKILSDFKKAGLDANETENLNKLNADQAEYENIQVKTLELISNNQKRNALNYFLENEGIVEVVQQDLRDLATYNIKEAEQTDNQNDKDVVVARFLIISIICFAIILAVTIGSFISKMITKPLAVLLEDVKEVAKGNLAIERIEVKSTDEIGQLDKAFNVMTQNLKDLVTHVTHSVEEISAGSEEMNAAADQTSQGAQQVATSVQQLAAGSQEQANNVTDSLENVNKINRAIQVVSDGAHNTVELSKSTEMNAAEGVNQAENAINKINMVKSTAAEIAETINELGKLSSDIEQIVDLIKQIASQTNLLALNAAIEAARAGEHGKGFAVVADEVKKLAGQSAEATNNITSMIKEIQDKTNAAVTAMNGAVKEVDDGVAIVSDTGKSLQEILEAAKATSNQIEDISSEVNKLAQNSDDVVRMMENISSITEESAASTEEIASIVEEQTASVEEISASSQALAKIAENLQKQISVFKV